jgi:hypothetical protein
MKFKRPSTLWIIPTWDLVEGDIEESISITGFDTPPVRGTICIVIPTKDDQQLRRIENLYYVTSVTASGNRSWPWDIDLEPIPVPSPQRWYDITERVMSEGLVPLSGVYGEGDIVSHPATLDLVFDLLGL